MRFVLEELVRLLVKALLQAIASPALVVAALAYIYGGDR